MSFIDTKNSFAEIKMELKKHDKKESAYCATHDLFQIYTYNKPGHADQNIQFSIDGLKDLVKILREKYPQIFTED